MKSFRNLMLIGISISCLIGIAACDKPGPAESAGKNIDNAVNTVGNKVSDTAEKITEKMTTQSNKVGVAIEDTEITTRVKAAVFAMPGLDTLQISVDTVKGVVALSGSVDSQVHSDTAKTLAQEVAGVIRVDNQLVIKPGK